MHILDGKSLFVRVLKIEALIPAAIHRIILRTGEWVQLSPFGGELCATEIPGGGKSGIDFAYVISALHVGKSIGTNGRTCGSDVENVPPSSQWLPLAHSL